MRYTIGQVVLFVHVNFIPNEFRMGNLYYPWTDKLIDISFKKLVCKEHHPISGDDYEDCQYDGFIFSEIKDNEEKLYFNNQYVQSYSVYDDSANWIIIDKTADECYRIYRDAEKHLKIILQVINSLKDREPVWSKQLQKHLDDLIILINEQGFNVEIKPIELKKLDGAVESFPGILNVTITLK